MNKKLAITKETPLWQFLSAFTETLAESEIEGVFISPQEARTIRAAFAHFTVIARKMTDDLAEARGLAAEHSLEADGGASAEAMAQAAKNICDTLRAASDADNVALFPVIRRPIPRDALQNGGSK